MPAIGPQVLDAHRFSAHLSERTSLHRRDIVAALAEATPRGLDAALAQRRIDEWYPELRDERGLREAVVTPRRAHSLGRDHGHERYLVLDDALDLHRSRERSFEREGRSR